MVSVRWLLKAGLVLQAVRNRDDAKNFIYEMAEFPSVKVNSLISLAFSYFSPIDFFDLLVLLPIILSL